MSVAAALTRTFPILGASRLGKQASKASWKDQSSNGGEEFLVAGNLNGCKIWLCADKNYFAPLGPSVLGPRRCVKLVAHRSLEPRS